MPQTNSTSKINGTMLNSNAANTNEIPLSVKTKQNKRDAGKGREKDKEWEEEKRKQLVIAAIYSP